MTDPALVSEPDFQIGVLHTQLTFHTWKFTTYLTSCLRWTVVTGVIGQGWFVDEPTPGGVSSSI